jgi:hypothetical protein
MRSLIFIIFTITFAIIFIIDVVVVFRLFD